MVFLSITVCTLFANVLWALDPTTLIIKSGPVINALQGTTHEIRCDVDSRPDGIATKEYLKTRWEREPKECSNSSESCRITLSIDRLAVDQQKYSLKFIPADTYILIIKNVDETDEGEYFCQLSLSRYVKVFDHVAIQVISPPVIDPLSTSSDMFVAIGDRVELSCGAFGRPMPVISWTRAGNAMLPGGGFVRIGSKMTISSMRAEFRGPYICTASNDNGETYRIINIDMNFPPELYASPPRVSQKVGYETRVFCNVNSQPSATVSWFINGKEVTADNTLYKVTTYVSAFKKTISKLTIYKVTQETFTSQIVCSAKNELGTNSINIRVFEANEIQPIPGAASNAPLKSLCTSLFLTILLLLFVVLQ